MAKAGKRYPLVIYTRMIDRWWPPLFFMGLTLLGFGYWFYSDLYTRLTAAWEWETMAGVGGAITLISLFMWAMHESAYVQPRSDHLLLATPFLRMNITYTRIRRATSASMAMLFPPRTMKGLKKEILNPLFPMTAVVVELNALPMPASTLRLFLSPFFFKDATPHLVIVVKDWMSFSTELESLRVSTNEPVRKLERNSSILNKLPKK
jgi:hypothetical protein